MDIQAKKTVLRLFTYGLYALTVAEASEAHGITVNWATQVSFEPPMVAISIQKDSKSLRLIREGGRFALNVLAAGQRELAGHLGRSSSRHPEKMHSVSTVEGPAGIPALTEALGYLECRVTGEVDAGDSVVFIAKIVDAHVIGEGPPLTMDATGFKHSG